MAVNLAPIFNDAPYVDSNGDPFSGALLYTYTAGSSTATPTYTTSAGNVQNANPMTLNSAGYPTTSSVQTQIWLTAGVSYKFELKNSAGTTIWTRDNITGINDTTVTIDQWVSGPTPTFIGATSFSLSGDQTSTFHPGRRLKSTNSGGTIYSTIVSSVFGALTTVTVVNDSGTLDSGLSAVSYGLLSATDPSTPLLTDAYPIVSGSSDKTKKARFEVDGLTTATTRVYTLQDSDDTLVGRATTDTLTNKTLTSPVINTAVTGTAVATQAQQETGTAVDVIVTPGRQHYHQSALKAWVVATTGGVATVGYNISSVTDTGPGEVTVNFTTAFSTANYCVTAIPKTTFAGAATGALFCSVGNSGQAAGSVLIDIVRASDGAHTDPSTSTMIMCAGDL